MHDNHDHLIWSFWSWRFDYNYYYLQIHHVHQLSQTLEICNPKIDIKRGGTTCWAFRAIFFFFYHQNWPKYARNMARKQRLMTLSLDFYDKLTKWPPKIQNGCHLQNTGTIFTKIHLSKSYADFILLLFHCNAATWRHFLNLFGIYKVHFFRRFKVQQKETIIHNKE